ncbi:MAG: phosphoglycerate dehydrogenase [Acidimicrobiales bacterium]
MARILVTEELAPTGLDKLRAAGHEVDIQLGLSPEELVAAMPGAAALIIRSATTVTEEVLAAGTDLTVVGRAGIGLDNVDVEAATKRGVMVCNAPQSNIVTTAEQTMALILAQARNIPQADAALKAGRWERSKWTGIELYDKTLGIVGLGRVGKLVAQRALAFGMKLIAYDPYISEDRARQLSVELVGLDELAARADIVTLHVIKTPETVGLIGADFFAKAKDGIRIINVARGGVVDEAALHDALVSGKAAAAGLDVFDTEPKTESPLFSLPNIVVTPHLGASTHEAQDKAGVTIAEQVNLALAGDFVPFAVNIDAAEVAGTMKPYLPLAEQLGRMFASFVGDLPSTVSVRFEGEIGGYDNRLATLSAIKGLLSVGATEPVSFVNANPLLAERGVTVTPVADSTSRDFVNKLTIEGGDHSMSATLVGLRDEARIIEIDGHDVDIPPSEHMLVVRNDDRPGVIGVVGTMLGEAQLNVSDMAVGRDPGGNSATMVITTRSQVPTDLIAKLASAEGILSVDAIECC